MMIRFSTALFLFLVAGCFSEKNDNKLFESVPARTSGVHFTNQVKNSERFNIFSYRNFYNGGGVAIGDINNDGLSDIYLTANMGDNKLYLNKGNFQFEDITEKAGVAGTKAWSTGVVLADVNADGLLDIYVCNAGYVEGDDQENELFINNGNLTFSEKAADYNLNENGYTTHAAFFDYDGDDDLDCYILNNSFMPVNTLNYSNNRELNSQNWPVADFLKGGGDKLLRNDNGKFIDVTKEAGIYGSLIGFGLGITVGDLNGDNWPDVYVSNDFYERDYLYINQKNGTFKEEIEQWMEHLPHASMGADMADINNDGFPEIFVTEMLPSDETRLKTTTLFENYNIYQLKQERGFYHQYMQNCLQFNNKDGSFSEIAFYGGVAASDWSWGALMFDADNDGLRDIYICNGIYRDVTDQDFIDFFANEVVQKMALTGKKEEMENVIEKMPSNPIPNKAFKNRGDLTFEDTGTEWGLEIPSFSNGAAYGDLDNDGDLDLVVNNLGQEAFLYRNRSESIQKHHYLSIRLKGSAQNPFAVGSKVVVYKGVERLNYQMIPTRGFQSSVDYKLVFGLGDAAGVDSLVVIWPDRTKSVLPNPPADTTLLITYSEGLVAEKENPYNSDNSRKSFFQEISSPFGTHKEDKFIDFYQEGLVMRMISKEGPKAAVGDVNGDGKDDVFIGGAAGQGGQLYLQTKNGFERYDSESFSKDSLFEDTAVLFFDADGDKDLDLFVGSGGNHRPAGSRFMQSRIYKNDAKGNFAKDERALPLNGMNVSVAVPLDFDEDSDTDLFVGSRSVPSQYGIPPKHFLFKNDGTGKFKDVTKTQGEDLLNLGMVTDAILSDVTGDEKKELIAVGEWASPQVFEIENGQLKRVHTSLDEYLGWWYTVETGDLDSDGDIDLILGNRGENFYFSGTKEQPAKLWVNDFDQNGMIEKIMTRRIDGKDMPIPLKKELTAQIPGLKKQNLKNVEYAKKAIQDLFPEDVLKKSLVLEANYFKSAVALNNGNGNFTLLALPKEVQFSCVCDIWCDDLNGDGKKDLVLGGNDSGFMPQFSKLDASFGHTLLNKGNGQFERVENRDSGFFVKGQVKQLTEIKIAGEQYLLVLVNGQKPILFSTSKKDEL